MACRACLRRAMASRSTLGQLQPVQIPVRAYTPQSSSPLLCNVAGPSRPRSILAGKPLSYATQSRSYVTSPSPYFKQTSRARAYNVSAQVSSRRTAATQLKPNDEPTSITHHGLIITPPSLSAIREEGYLDDDVQLLPEEEAWINISPEAIAQLVKITSKEPKELLDQNKLALRVGVESGGCHGYQYTMEIVEERGTDDYVLQPEGVNCIPVVVDLISLGLLKGSTLHHATELIGSSFRLQDNPQAKEGGNCGCGVSWELK